MVRTQSLLVRMAMFGVLATVFAVLLAFRREGTRPSNDSAGSGPAFPSFGVEKVTSIEIEQTTKASGKDAKESVKLVRSNPTAPGAAVWKLASSFDYTADTGKVETYLKKLKGVARHDEPTSNPAKFGEFAGTEGFLEVRVFESDAAPTLSFGVGKAAPDSGYPSKKFVRVDDAPPSKSARILVVSGLDEYGSPTSPTQWVETRMLPLLTSAEIAELSIEQGEAHRTVAFTRGKKKDEKDADDPWNMTAPTPGPALVEPVMSIVRAFVGLSLASIEAGKTPAGDDAKYGFDKPDLVLKGTGKTPADLSASPTWTVVIGRKVEGKSAWYARRSTGEAVDPFVFTINDYDLSEFRKEPATWLEKKPEPPATPLNPETPAMGETSAMGDTPPATSDPAGMDAATPGMDTVPPGMDTVPPGMDTVPPGMDAAAPPPTPTPGTPAPGGSAPPAPAPSPAPETPKPPDAPKEAPPK